MNASDNWRSLLFSIEFNMVMSEAEAGQPEMVTREVEASRPKMVATEAEAGRSVTTTGNILFLSLPCVICVHACEIDADLAAAA